MNASMNRRMIGPDHYHAHVYFEPNQQQRAAQLREQLDRRFAVGLGRLYPMPIGPHSKGMFQASFDQSQFGEVVPWLLANRDGLDVLVHGYTGDDWRDHTELAMWLGQPVALRLEGFKPSRRADAR